MPSVILLGATGSIGRQTIQVCQAQGFPITALSANQDAKGLADAARQVGAKAVCIADPNQYQALKTLLADTSVQVTAGKEALCALAAQSEGERVVNAIVGMAGLWPTLAAIDAKKDIALANKETLVAAGELVLAAVRRQGVALLPIDSEHSAIFQCLQGVCGPDAQVPYDTSQNTPRQLRKIWLTASGGPFFGKTKAQLGQITPAQALRHPTWSMGAKITIDSATLMNKGLEVMEACYLFGVKPCDIQVVVHPESILHSAVELVDFGVIGQMGLPDMQLPIQYALTYPHRKPCPAKPLSLPELGALHFYEPDETTFACLPLCKQAMEQGGAAPLAVNAANEEAVARFLKEEIGFLQIAELCAQAMERFGNQSITCPEQVAEIEKEVRAFAFAYQMG